MVKQITVIVNDWSEIVLGEVLKYEQPYRYAVDDTQYSSNSGIPVLTAGKSFILGYTNETNGVYSNLPVIIFDDFTTDCKYVDFPFKVKSSAMKFLKEKNENQIDLKYMFEILQSVKLQTTGGDHKRRWISEYSKIKINAPKFKEQTRIAQMLSKADAAIAQTEALIAKYQHIKTGLMQDLLTRGIDEYGNIRSKSTHRFVVKNGIEVPEEWNVKTPKEFAKITTGASDTQDRDDAGQYPFFVRSQTIEKSNRYIFEGEAVLTSGDGVGVGKIYHYANGKFDFHQRVYLMYDFLKDFVLGKYFFYYFKENFYNEVSKYSAKTTVDSVRMKMIADMLIPIPKYPEQLKIVETLDKIDDYIDRERKELNKLQSLKTGLMQDLLSGKVRVT